MQIQINDPKLQTVIFSIILLCLLLVSLRKTKLNSFFSLELTQELKGFAMLAIIFSHIGYFLSANNQFLFPLSILAGVGVNMFLFLSGFGLTSSITASKTSVFDFYKKRLINLFLPLWIVVSILLLFDWILLQRIYPISEVIFSYLGFFPQANIWQNIDSPLWYFSLIFFYYLAFPLTFWRKIPYLCPIIILSLSFLLLKLNLPIDSNVRNLYKVHSLSFPLGIMFALTVPDLSKILSKPLLKLLLISIFLIVAVYTSFNSGVGININIEQTISLITMFSFIFVFMLKNIEFRLFYIFGKYSFFIYLIHWPILSRYDLFYKYFPAFLATIFHLGLFLGLGYLLEKMLQRLGSIKFKSMS